MRFWWLWSSSKLRQHCKESSCNTSFRESLSSKLGIVSKFSRRNQLFHQTVSFRKNNIFSCLWFLVQKVFWVAEKFSVLIFLSSKNTFSCCWIISTTLFSQFTQTDHKLWQWVWNAAYTANWSCWPFVHFYASLFLGLFWSGKKMELKHFSNDLNLGHKNWEQKS